MFTLKDVLEVSNKLNIKFDKFTKEEIKKQVEFQEKYFKSEIIM